MKCEEVQALLPAYLDGEVTPSERALVRAHLSSCTVCQQELDLLSTARSQVRAALQSRAVQAVPSRDAWSRLEARLTEAAQPSSSKFAAWFSRKAPSVSRPSNQFLGGVTMRKRWILSGLAGVIALTVLAILVAQSVIPVSAHQILDRAYEVQTQQAAKQGIQHIRSEIYSNIEGSPEKPGMDTTVESYLDMQSGNVRLVVTDNQTGKVLQVFAYDGTNAYNAESAKDGQQSDDPLTVYRTPQSQPSELGQKFRIADDKLDAKTMFDKMRNDPQVQFAGQETWEDGRAVYVLRSQQPIKIVVNDEVQTPMGLVTVYFNVDTYELVGSRVTMEKDGQEVLVMSQSILVEEILPEGSSIAWDLSDLQGVNIVDDANGEHGMSEAISVEQLAYKTKTAFLLQSVPEGYSLEISTMANPPSKTTFFYSATYSKGEDYFIIRAWTDEPVKDTSWSDETYTTNSGLVLYFVTEAGVTSSGAPITSALVNTPEGISLAINSTLPRETIKALAEELVLVK